MIPVFRGVIKDGKPKIYQSELFELYLKQFKEGQEIKYSISRYSKARSNNQNSYMWGCVYGLISDFTGYTNDEVHDAMRIKFLKIQDAPITIIRSTSSLSTVEMEDYLSKIRTWASSELGVSIPLPHEVQI